MKVKELKLDVVGENDRGEQKHVVLVCHDVDHYDHEADSVAVLEAVGKAILASCDDAGKVEIFANEEGPSDLEPGIAVHSEEFDQKFGVVLRGAADARKLKQDLDVANSTISSLQQQLAAAIAAAKAAPAQQT